MCLALCYLLQVLSSSYTDSLLCSLLLTGQAVLGKPPCCTAPQFPLPLKRAIPMKKIQRRKQIRLCVCTPSRVTAA